MTGSRGGLPARRDRRGVESSAAAPPLPLFTLRRWRTASGTAIAAAIAPTMPASTWALRFGGIRFQPALSLRTLTWAACVAFCSERLAFFAPSSVSSARWARASSALRPSDANAVSKLPAGAVLEDAAGRRPAGLPGGLPRPVPLADPFELMFASFSRLPMPL